MEPKYWQEQWQKGKIGFHQSDVNKRLMKLWPQLNLPETQESSSGPSVDSLPLSSQGSSPGNNCVLVPLCGKSIDMLWLHEQGHQVLGIELSEKAVKAFFEENQFSCTIDHIDGFIRYTGTEAAAGITLLVGDYFALTPAHTVHCTRLYDRAALIALEPATRSSYVEQLAKLMPAQAKGLLLAISYDQSKMQGPPFSVSDDEVYHLMTEKFDIQELAHYSGPERVGNLAERGLETLDERAYLLSRK